MKWLNKLISWLFKKSPQDKFFEKCFYAGLTPTQAAELWLAMTEKSGAHDNNL